MTQQDWARVTDLLESILDHPAEEGELLAAEPAGIRDEVRRLLAATRANAPIANSRPLRRIANRYERIQLLGSGGSGEAWLALDHQTETQVVIKLPLHWEWFREHLTERFLAEAEILRRLEHPGIVGMLDSGSTAEGEPYFVMPFVEGNSLRVHMDAGPMSAETVAHIVEQLGEALDSAHQAQIIHRDIKPENIMLRSEAGELRVVLIDFGIAQIADLQTSGGTTTKFFGTTRYMAPEQLLGNPTFASDVYALALIAHEMLTAKPLFQSEGPVGLYEEQRKFRVTALSQSIAAHVREGIAAGLHREPQQRPSSREFSQQLAMRLRSKSWPWRPSRRLVLSSATTAAAASAWYFYTHRPIPIEERTFTYKAGQTYTEVGWRQIGKIDLDVTMFDPKTNSILGNRLASTDQGAYVFRLSERVRRQGLTRPWRAIANLIPIHGNANFTISFPELGVRFTAGAVMPDVGAPFLDLPITYRPKVTATNCPAPLRNDKLSELQLVFDPKTATVSALLDGKTMITGHPGNKEFLGAGGGGIGIGPHASKSAEAVFGDFTFQMD